MSLLDAFRRRASTLPDTRHAEFEASDGAKARVNPGEDELEALITRHQRDAVLLDPPPAPVAADYAARAKAIAGYVARELGGEAPRVKFFGRLHDLYLFFAVSCHFLNKGTKLNKRLIKPNKIFISGQNFGGIT